MVVRSYCSVRCKTGDCIVIVAAAAATVAADIAANSVPVDDGDGDDGNNDYDSYDGVKGVDKKSVSYLNTQQITKHKFLVVSSMYNIVLRRIHY